MRRKRLSSLSFLFCPSMRKENLMNFLNSDDRFSFKVGDYLVPILFKTCRKFIISLKENRSINLNQGKSKYVRYFEVLLKHFLP